MKKLWKKLPLKARVTLWATAALLLTAFAMSINNEADTFIGETYDEFVMDNESTTGEKFDNLPETAGTGAAVIEFEKAQTDEEKADAARAEYNQ